jgi:hypothetical protein
LHERSKTCIAGSTLAAAVNAARMECETPGGMSAHRALTASPWHGGKPQGRRPSLRGPRTRGSSAGEQTPQRDRPEAGLPRTAHREPAGAEGEEKPQERPADHNGVASVWNGATLLRAAHRREDRTRWLRLAEARIEREGKCRLFRQPVMRAASTSRRRDDASMTPPKSDETGEIRRRRQPESKAERRKPIAPTAPGW